MDWLGVFLGALLIRTMVGGSALLGVFYIWLGNYAFAAGILVPLAGIMAWMAMDVRSSSVPELDGE